MGKHKDFKKKYKLIQNNDNIVIYDYDGGLERFCKNLHGL